MIPLSLRDLQILMAAASFVLGCLSIILGLIVLITRGYSSEVQVLDRLGNEVSRVTLSNFWANIGTNSGRTGSHARNAIISATRGL